MKLPKISVNIPLIINGNPSIVLKSLKKIDYPKELYEIIIIEGNQISRQRNIGIKKSSGQIIYLLDDDSQTNPDAFKIIAKEFLDQKVAAVGGPSLTPKTEGNYLNQLIGYVLETYFGAFRMRYKWSRQSKNKSTSDYHLIGANLALRKKYITEVGGFDEKIIPNEETELLRRLKTNKFKIKYIDSLYIYRNQRKDLFGLAKQFHYYGRGRMKQISKCSNIQDLFLFIPVCFGFYLLSLFFFHPLWYFFPLGIYYLLSFATSTKAAVKYKKPTLFITMPLIFPIVHLSYALGLLDEFFRSKNIINSQDKSAKKINKKTNIKARVEKRFCDTL